MVAAEICPVPAQSLPTGQPTGPASGSGCRRHQQVSPGGSSQTLGATLTRPLTEGPQFPLLVNWGCRSPPGQVGEGLRHHRAASAGGHRLHGLQRRPTEQLLPALHPPLPAQRVPAGPAGRGRGLPGLRQVRPRRLPPPWAGPTLHTRQPCVADPSGGCCFPGQRGRSQCVHRRLAHPSLHTPRGACVPLYRAAD